MLMIECSTLEGQLPSDVSEPVFVQNSQTFPTYSVPNDFVLPVLPAGADVDFSNVGTIETFSSPVFSAPTLGTISSMNLPAEPVAPILSTTTVTETGISSPVFVEPSMGELKFADANTWINTEEDGEMLQARISEITARLQEFQIRLEGAMADFNKENAIFQKDIQIAITNAQLQSEEDAQKLQEYNNGIQIYAQNINKEVERWTGEVFEKEFNEWTQKYQGQLQEYNIDVQKESARVASSLSEYQVKVDKALNEYQSETGFDVSVYMNEVQANNTKFQNDLTKNSTKFQNDLAKYTSEVQKVISDNQNKIATYGTEVQDYVNKVQKIGLSYGWMESRLSILQQEYDNAFALMAPRQQQGE